MRATASARCSGEPTYDSGRSPLKRATCSQYAVRSEVGLLGDVFATVVTEDEALTADTSAAIAVVGTIGCELVDGVDEYPLEHPAETSRAIPTATFTVSRGRAAGRTTNQVMIDGPTLRVTP